MMRKNTSRAGAKRALIFTAWHVSLDERFMVFFRAWIDLGGGSQGWFGVVLFCPVSSFALGVP